MKIKHILFPVDFSERCATAVPFVENMARRYEARITLLTVLHPYYGGGIAGSPVFDVEKLRDETKAQLDHLFLTEFGEIPVHRVMDTGDPGHTIAKFAHENAVDLIMLPTHGYGPFRQLLMGSTTAKVLHDAHCPVWTDAHTGEAPDQLHMAMKNVVCAVDTNADQRAATVSLIKQAAGLAKQWRAKLRLIHAVPGIEAWPERQMDRDYEEEIRDAARKTIEGLEHDADVDVPICINAGTVPDVIQEELTQHGADLLVIGRGSIQERLGRLRTHAHSIIRSSPCPVISI